MAFYADRYTQFTIICDKCYDHDGANSNDMDMPRNTNEAHKYFRDQGWKIGKGLAVCPNCKEEE
ncbi:hypothetical protein D3P96_02870 [Weissella viridescens]|uniref:Uncharacterized protein n=1 Tax=Weissella viridescens TaxID=1629 RepID=A0A3P2RC65_WEIVI|nr:hypothetical protein D3P96_02870 [Weissella viridescens]